MERVPTADEFRQIVDKTNFALSMIGVRTLNYEGVCLNVSSTDSSYHPGFGQIQLGIFDVATLAHEAYHKHAADSVLLPAQILLIDNIRRGVSMKFRNEIKSRHEEVSEHLRIKAGHLGKVVASFVGAPGRLSLEDVYLFYCQDTCGGFPDAESRNEFGRHFARGDEQFPVAEFALPILVYENNALTRAPFSPEVTGLTCLSEILTETERFLIGEVMYLPDALKLYPRRTDATKVGTGLAEAVGKLSSHVKRMDNVDEAPAFLISAWLKGYDLDDIENLRGYISRQSARSLPFGKKENAGKLVDIVVDSYAGFRQNGHNITDSIAKTVEINQYLSIARPV